MAKKANQKLKLYRLAQIMLEQTDEAHGLSMSHIRDELLKYDISADRKSLYRDLEDLGDLGIVIERRKQGRQHVYYVSERLFELPELKLLVDAVGASKFITESKSSVLIRKLMRFTSRHEASQLNRQVYVSGRVKTMNESIYYNVDVIHAAIAKNRQITFEYLYWDTQKNLIPKRQEPYEVSPWGLLWYDENYYLIAFDSKAGIIKHYRVDKMRSITGSQKFRDGEKFFFQFDPAAYANKSFGMYSGHEERVRLRFENSIIGVLIDRFGKDIDIHPVDEIYSDTIVSVAVSHQFFGWIFGLGGHVKIMAPDSVVEQFRGALHSLAEEYAYE